jgi:hypothetical protein
MKKLNKLGISPKKIMKNEELINLQGGYSGEDGNCLCQKWGSDATKRVYCACTDSVEAACGSDWDFVSCY